MGKGVVGVGGVGKVAARVNTESCIFFQHFHDLDGFQVVLRGRSGFMAPGITSWKVRVGKSLSFRFRRVAFPLNPWCLQPAVHSLVVGYSSRANSF